MNHLDLFSGIGGFSYAADQVWGKDHNIVLFVEKDNFCKKVLKKHWPDVPIIHDIEEYVYDRSEKIDLLTGGFPCQPFSIAGKQKGKSDDRYLWPEMFRVIQEAKPTWIIGENVPGIINMGLETTVADLEAEGYEVELLVLPACGVGAWHQRYRVWILAHSGYDDRIDVEISENDEQRSIGPSEGQKRTIKPTGSNGGEGRPTNVENAGCRNQGECSDSLQESTKWDSQENSTNSTCGPGPYVTDTNKQHGNNRGSGTSEISQFAAAGIFEGEQWNSEPGVGRVANGIPNRVDRLKGLGNAIVPQAVIPIMRYIKLLTD